MTDVRNRTPEEIIVEAITIIQRNLPGGDLSDRETINELWGVLDSPSAADLYYKIHRAAGSYPGTQKT